MSDKRNQCMTVLQYIREHGSITAWDAMTKLGVGRLSARIWDLRTMGYPVLTTRSGEKANYAIYILDK